MLAQFLFVILMSSYPNIVILASCGKSALPVRIEVHRVDRLALIMPRDEERCSLHGSNFAPLLLLIS